MCNRVDHSKAAYATVAILIIIVACVLQPQYLITSEIDVKAFGAIGDGITDDSSALKKAWDVACGSTGQFKIPTGSFLVGPMKFSGPCKAKTVVVNVVGNVKAQPRTAFPKNTDTWISFEYIENLVVNGPGSFNGQGDTNWWPFCDRTKNCEANPTSLGFHSCKGLKLIGVTSINSPGSHLAINACNGATIKNININAPKKSPNTDGIDISSSVGLNIYGGNIATGDDCIAINGGCSNINITNLSCGPGHGISVGSLGRNGAKEAVSNVRVAGINFIGAKNGVRIKTVPGGSGSARQITFSNIRMKGVTNPIILSQFYCPHVDPKDCKDIAPAVQVSGISFIDIKGTSSSSDAINIDCSAIRGSCAGITLEQINLQPVKSSIKVVATCQNAKVQVIGPVFPPVVCTTASSIMMPLDHDYDERKQAIAAT